MVVNRDPVALSPRDFLYLDTERVRSVVAQLRRWLSTNHSASAGESFAEGAAGRVVSNRAPESGTSYDDIYDDTEAHLIEQGQLLQFPGSLEAATFMSEDGRRRLPPAGYLLVEGRVVLSDYRAFRELLGESNEMEKLVARLGFQKRLREASPSQRVHLKRELEQKSKNSQMDDGDRKGLQRLVEIYFRDGLTLEVIPFAGQDIRVVCPLDRACLRESLDHIRLKYGSAPEYPWRVFGQIAAIPPENPTAAPNRANAVDLKLAMDTAFASTRSIEQSFGIRYPDISITPIAIYRE